MPPVITASAMYFKLSSVEAAIRHLGICIEIEIAAIFAHIEIVTLLRDSGANIESRDNYTFRPLHLAVRKCHFPTVKKLAERNAEINAHIEHRATTALKWAYIYRQEEISSYLKLHGGIL